MKGHWRGSLAADLREIYEAENPLAEILVKIFRSVIPEEDFEAVGHGTGSRETDGERAASRRFGGPLTQKS